MKRNLYLLISLLVFFLVQPLFAQEHWSLKISTCAAFATENLAEAELNTGFGFEGVVAYRFLPHLGAYVGWGWQHFSANQSFAGSEVDFEETGYSLGLQFVHPLGYKWLSYFLQAGTVINHIEVENSEREIIGDSQHGFGWQAGAGLFFSVGENWGIMPGMFYRSLSRDIEIETVKTPADLRYFALGFAVTKGF